LASHPRILTQCQMQKASNLAARLLLPPKA
jgi:hypothetical protein